MKKDKLKKGNLIIADTNVLNDLQFNRAVILLTKHNSEGSLGFIINKKLNYTLKDFIRQTDCKFRIFYGGPVEVESLYFIHTKPDIIPNSIEIADGIFWGGDFNKIIESINNNQFKKSEIRFFLGYTGWDLGQLKNEIKTNSWLIKDNIYSNYILKKVPSNLWKELIMSFGNKKLIWCNAPEDPVLN